MAAWKQIRVGGVTLDLEPPAQDKITFVGSRRKDIPDKEYELMATAYPRIARALVAKGIIAVSGGADGMDQLAENAFGKSVISYRTDRRAYAPSFVRVLDDRTYPVAERMVAALHPAWDRVKPEHRALHARNMAQVLQDDLRHPTAFLVAWAKPKGVSVEGGTRSAFELSRIVHDGEKTYNLATVEGQRGLAKELRTFGVPIERGTWYPRETRSLSDHAKALIAEGHSRIGIAIPVGSLRTGAVTNAERANISQKHADALALAKRIDEPSIIGDAWNNRVVLIAVPYVGRDEQSRGRLITDLNAIAASNSLSRIVLPHEDVEPKRDVFPDVQRMLGPEGTLDSKLTFATMPEGHRGLSKVAIRTIGQTRNAENENELSASR
jgi:hypothetical protein